MTVANDYAPLLPMSLGNHSRMKECLRDHFAFETEKTENEADFRLNDYDESENSSVRENYDGCLKAQHQRSSIAKWYLQCNDKTKKRHRAERI